MQNDTHDKSTPGEYGTNDTAHNDRTSSTPMFAVMPATITEGQHTTDDNATEIWAEQRYAGATLLLCWGHTRTVLGPTAFV